MLELGAITEMIRLIGPAGNSEMALAAMDAGADDLYTGLLNWSLRSPCFEMNIDQLSNLSTIAETRGKVVRVALNTYPWQSDIPCFDRQIDALADVGIKSIILADIASIASVRSRYHDMFIQASVGADVHSLMDVLALEDAGATSITLSRPIPDFISQVKKQTRLKVEIFAHGYLNYTYRARCYMSSYLRHSYDPLLDRCEASGSFNREGFCNRACKCHWAITNGYLKVCDVMMNSYPFVAIDHLVELLRAGVDGLKIQGRENSISLVQEAVALYRKVLDGFHADPESYRIPEGLVFQARSIDRDRHREMCSRSGIMIREMLGIEQDGSRTAKGQQRDSSR